MFEKAPKSYTDLLGKTNRLVEGTVVQGNISTAADFRLDGTLTGDLKCGGKLVIGPTAMIRGDIVCRNADVEGKVFGKIEVFELLSLKAKSSIHGEVICAKLSVEPGADFSASCEMRPNPKTNSHAGIAKESE
ncbi:bactofilin family protein [Flavobacterium silvaticum]|uniref:Polymer-forming cytoskeletal protein n=1 Tax=Flavobacterium silvaticum TaxID=1852020 RepID=A0A972JHW4_9FLAO|nr:polymer-forming cytoskeletal protein [Flavobacterium silvaticum]NMH28365.1 polymer-forming cytoskeletal protein [Flavobacterium silvaticum]